MSKQVKALSSTLRLLVYLRAVLKVEGAEETPLFKTIDAHMLLVGTALPKKELLTPAERQKIESAARGEAPPQVILPETPGSMVVLAPQHFQKGPGV